MSRVGESVRVRLSEAEACRGVVCVYDGDSAQVLLADGRDVTVSLDKLSALLEVEQASADALSPAQLKDAGNAVFALKDYLAARSYYMRALALLSASSSTVGANVLVGDKYVFRHAVVCDVCDDEVCVMHDDTDHEEVCAKERVHPAGQQGSDYRALCRALYMNLGRSSVQLGHKGWAVRWFSLALVLVLANDSSSDSSKHLADAYSARCRAYLNLGKLNLAKNDAVALSAFDAQKSASLLREAEQGLVRTRQQDRRLARDVASWVGVAMEASTTAHKGESVEGRQKELREVQEGEEEEEEEEEEEGEGEEEGKEEGKEKEEEKEEEKEDGDEQSLPPADSCVCS